MEILKKNFEASLPTIRAALLDADFISINAEFTGLFTPDAKFSSLDDIQRRYSKAHHHIQSYTIVQYGVCAFKQTASGITAKPFNFYVYGGDTDNIQSNRNFLSNASSLSFLQSNRFDFNKLIDQGIPFYNYAEERSLFTTNSGHDIIGRHPATPDTSLNKHSRSFIELLRNNLAIWLQKGATNPLVVSTNNGHQKKLVYQELQHGRYNGFLKGIPRDTRNMHVVKIKSEDRFEKSPKSPTLNFRHVIEAIKEAKCPVVIHNGMYDVCHTVDQFWHNLPEQASDFKKLVNTMWNTVVDTKYMAEFHPILQKCFNSTVLGSLFNTVEEELRNGGHVIRMADGFDRYSVEGNPNSSHEAGYDAYMTGVIYLGFVHYIKEKEEEEQAKISQGNGANNKTNDVSTSTTSSKDSLFMNESITPFYNKIFLMRCDQPYIDLQGEEKIERNRFFLTKIPTGVTHADIERLYPDIQPTYLSWINDTSAWLTIRHSDNIEKVTLGRLGSEQLGIDIPPQVADMELLSGEQWLALQSPVNNNNNNSKLNDVPTTTIPNGASSYDDFDIPLPASFKPSKRESPAPDEETGGTLKKQKS
ncbi:unnamed protein product [Absidia cylindrospora]